jgi:hypothetical protein
MSKRTISHSFISMARLVLAALVIEVEFIAVFKSAMIVDIVLKRL